MNIFNVVMKSTERVDSNLNNEDFHNADHWKCVLGKGRKTMTVYFSKGYGHNGAEPTVKEILECLVVDASYMPCDFDEWCSNLGYDADSRKDKKIYDVCVKQAIKLRAFMGDDYDALIGYEF
jgi:hypothetical protein